MTVRTDPYLFVNGTVADALQVNARFDELYDLQDGGIDGTNMDLTATFAWAGTHSFAGPVTFDTNLLAIDPTNNRIYSGATATISIDAIDYQFQIKGLSNSTDTLALISTATGTTGVREVRYHYSASPANGDRIWDLGIYGKNNAAADKKFGTILCIVDDVASGSEDSHITIQAFSAGTLGNGLLIYGDQVQVAPESLVVGATTNITDLAALPPSLYVKTTRNAGSSYVAVFESSDNGASPANVAIYKKSSSPAASDGIGFIQFAGNDSGGNVQEYASILAEIVDPTSGSEDGRLILRSHVAGSTTDHITISNGTTAITGLATITSTTTTSDACTITASSLTTGSALVVYSNSSSSSTRNLVEITNDHASADNAVCLNIQQDGDDDGIYVVKTSAGYGLNLDSSGVNSASDYTGLLITTGNAGAGSAICIEFAGSVDDYFRFTAGVLTSAAGTYYGRYPVDVPGVGRKYTHLFNA